MLTRLLNYRVLLALAVVLAAYAPRANAAMLAQFCLRPGCFRMEEAGTWSPWNPYKNGANIKAILDENVSSHGFAHLQDHTFTPKNACTGDWGEVRTHVKFRGQGRAALGDGHIGLRIVDVEDRQMFMVLSGSEWVAVDADGVVPSYDRDYVVGITVYYSLGCYTVSVNGRVLAALSDGTTEFALPAGSFGYTQVHYEGQTDFRSVVGEQGTSYPCAWTGNGNGKWGDGANWVGGSAPSASAVPSFVEGRIAASGARTVLFDGAFRINGGDAFSVAAGTPSSPLVFQASSAGNGLTAPRLELGLVGLKACGVLLLKGGTYNFTGGAYIGQDVAHTGRLMLGGGSVPTVVSFQPNDLQVRPGSSLVGRDAVLSAKNFYLSSDEGVALTNVAFTTTQGFCVGFQDGSCGVVEKVGGDWSVANEFWMGKANGSRSVFRHHGGTLDVGIDHKWFVLGNGLDSENAFYNIDGTLNVHSWLVLGNNASSTRGRNYMEISGGTVNQSDVNHVVIGFKSGGNTANELRVSGGVLNARQDIFIGGNSSSKTSGGSGKLTLDKGEVNAPNGWVYLSCCDRGGTLELNGGSLLTKVIKHGGGQGEGRVAFNGGTLKAAAKATLIQNHELLVVDIQKSSTIDNGGFDVTLAKSMKGSGALTLAGEGVTTFSADQLYTGKTTVGEGTGIKSGAASIAFAGTLAFTNDSRIVVAQNKNGCNGLSAAAVELPENGTVTVALSGTASTQVAPVLTQTGGNTFSLADLQRFHLASEDFHLALSKDARSICLVPGSAYVWTGAPGGDLCHAGNWQNGKVPNGANANEDVTAVISVAQDTTLLCSGVFSPTSIIFPAGSAKVTIETNGSGAISNILRIANFAVGKQHEFKVPVAFADGAEADVTLEKDVYMEFPGGLAAWDALKKKASDAARLQLYVGSFHFLKPNIDWSEKHPVRVMRDGTLTLNGARNAQSFGIYTGGRVRIEGDMPVTDEANTTHQLVWRVYGKLDVANRITLSGAASLKPAASYGYGAYAAEGLYNGSTGRFFLNTTDSDFTAHWEIGMTGLAASKNSGGYYVCAGSPATLNSAANYTIAAPIDAAEGARLNIGTGNAADRTITVSGVLSGGMAVELSGAGTVAFNSASTFAGGLVATNGVTLALGPGARPGNGAVVMKSGTTLAVCGGGEVGALAFADGSTLDVLNPETDTPAFRVAGALTLPSAAARVALRTNGGAFGAGVYAILKNDSVETGVGAKFAPLVEGGLEYRFRVKNDVLMLVVYAPDDRYRWTGWGENNNLSNPDNWMCGRALEKTAKLVFAEPTTVNADLSDSVTLANLELKDDVTVNGALKTTTNIDTSHLVVGEGATVTLVGDLVFTGDGRAYIAKKIDDGGRLVVTGRIEARDTREVYPTDKGGSGYIIANGLKQNSAKPGDFGPFKLVRDTAGTVHWAIGSDGMDGNSDSQTFWLLNNPKKPVAEIRPIANDVVIKAKIATRQHATLQLNTTGLDDDKGHTITVTKGIYREGNVHVKGKGKVLCQYQQTDSANNFFVDNAATLELADGANLGNKGSATVDENGTLAVSGGGAVVGALTFTEGSTLKATALRTDVAALSATCVALPASGTVCLDVAAFAQNLSTGSYKLITCPNGIDSRAVDAFALSGCTLPEGRDAWLSVVDNTLYLMVNDPANQVYVGSASNNLSDPAGWVCGCVPVSGVAVMAVDSSRELDVGNVFRPDTITFADHSGIVTLARGSLHLASLTNACKLAIGPEASLEIDGDLVAEVNVASSTNVFLYSNAGSVVVGGLAIGYANVGKASLFQYAEAGEATRPIQANGICYFGGGHGQLYMRLCADKQKAGMWVVGEKGLSYLNGRNANYSMFYVEKSGGDATLYSSANWTLASLANGGKSNQTNGDLWLGVDASLTLDTSDYANPKASGHDITLRGRMVTDAGAGTVALAGNGRVIVDTAPAPESFSEDQRHMRIATALAVTDSVTLQIKDGKKIIGGGTVSFDAGTTLDILGGAVVNCAVTMARGATLSLGSANGDSAPLMVGGEFSVSGTRGKVSVRIGGGTVGAGTYTLLEATSLSANADDFTLQNVAAGCTATFALGGSKLVVHVTASTPQEARASAAPCAAACTRELWAAKYNVAAFDAAAERAFLLGVAPDADTSFDIVRIEKGTDAVTLWANRELKGVVNGVVFVRYGRSPGQLDKTSAVVLGDGGRVTVPFVPGEPVMFKLCVGNALP